MEKIDEDFAIRFQLVDRRCLRRTNRMRSPDNKQRGIESENRIMKYLLKTGKAVKINKDVDNPDILWSMRIKSIFPSLKKEHYCVYALEAKSVTAITKGQIGVIAITQEQWNETKKYARSVKANPALIIEIIIKGSFEMYWLLGEDVIEKKMGETMASFTVWQVIDLGERI